MPLFVHKFPPSGLVAECRVQEASPGASYVEMSQNDLDAFVALWAPRRLNPVVDDLPTFDASTQRLVPYLQADEQANVFRKKWSIGDAVKAMRESLKTATDEVDASITEINTYLAITSPSAAQVAAELKNAVQRQKKAAQREKAINRILRSLIKTAYP